MRVIYLTKKKKTKGPRLVYCGPNVPGGLLTSYTVYKNGIPAHLQATLEKCPDLKYLFVPVEKLVNAREEIKTSGAFLHQKYEVVRKHFKGVS